MVLMIEKSVFENRKQQKVFAFYVLRQTYIYAMCGMRNRVKRSDVR